LQEGLSLSTTFRDRNGRLLRLTLSEDDKYRLWVPLDAISPKMVEATLLYEDRYFHRHFGVNPVSLSRAFWQTYITKDRTIGASTITMQLARLRYGLHTRTVAGKLYQILKAVQLEWHYTKDDIIEAYLNLAPYGGNIEGIGAASEIYFEKQPGDLTLAEALLLSVIPQRPAARAPYKDALADNTEIRITVRRSFLDRWLKEHPEDQAIASEVLTERVVKRPGQLPFRAPHFVNMLVAAGSQNGGVSTTLDLGLQNLLRRRIRQYVERNKTVGIKNAAAMLLDYRFMDVMALAGSADFMSDEIQGQVDGTRAKRSPGSTLKPFIYALAMDQGLIHPMTMLRDAPTSFGAWQPGNYDEGFSGPISVREALIRSRNVPAIQVAAQLGDPDLYGFLHDVGIKELRPPDFYGLALVLGGAETSMHELVHMYAMLANGGILRPLRFKTTDPISGGRRMLTPESSWLVLNILRDNPRPGSGYDRKWSLDGVDVAWKTGTSYSFRDAWSIGIFGPYVLAVWIGNFNGESNPVFVGRKAAAPLFFEIVDAVKAHRILTTHALDRTFPQILKVAVCSVSGQIPGPYCKNRVKSWFIPGRSPIRTCDIHRSIIIDSKTGLRACPSVDLKDSRMEVFEFWPSDLLDVFRIAGIPRRIPPPWHPGCSIQARRHQGIPPQITSPRRGLIYNIRMTSQVNQEIPLTAITDADAGQVYWFMDNAYLGASPSARPFFWSPKSGEYTIQAVDSLGRSDSRKITLVMVE
jgi:penicillin-binding protein 1C